MARPPFFSRRATQLLRRFSLILLLTCLFVALVLASALPNPELDRTVHDEDALRGQQTAAPTSAPSTPPTGTTGRDATLTHTVPPSSPASTQETSNTTTPSSPPHVQLREQRRQEEAQARRKAAEALATVQDVVAKLMEGDTIPLSSHHDRTGREHAAGTEAWRHWQQGATTPLEQSAYYYHAMEALYQQGNITLFAERLQEGAEASGHGRMHYLLGVLYANGVGVPRSESTAVLHFSFAALQGVPEAHLALAQRLEVTGASPTDTPLDKCQAALPHYHEAADAVALTYDGNLGSHPYGLSAAGATTGSTGLFSSVGASGDEVDDADGIRLVEGQTPRANALRHLRDEQLRLVHLIVHSDDGNALASLNLGLYHLKTGAQGSRNRQLAKRYLLKSLSQLPGFIEVYLQKAERAAEAARLTVDPHASPFRADLLEFVVGANKAATVAATYGLNPPLNSDKMSPKAASSSSQGATKTKTKQSGAGADEKESYPAADSSQVRSTVAIAGQVYGLLGQLYGTGDAFADPPMPRDFAKALYYFRRGLMLGDCTALNGLGFLHAVGYLHDGRTVEEAAIYEAALAASNDTERQSSYASTTKTGSDFASAEQYFRIGALHSTCAMSAYNLGVFYLHGLDDLARRSPPAPTSASAGPTGERAPPGHRTDDGFFVPSRATLEKAEQLFRTAASQGSVLGLWQLGRLAERAGNCSMALALYRRVASYGSWMHAGDAASPWAFALMEDWKDTILQEKMTAQHVPTHDEPQYGAFLEQRLQARQAQRDRLATYQQVARTATGHGKEAFLRTLRQHAAGQQNIAEKAAQVPQLDKRRGQRQLPNVASSSSSSPTTTTTHTQGSSTTPDARPTRGGLNRLLRAMSRLLFGWNRRTYAVADVENVENVAEPALRPAATPLPDMVHVKTKSGDRAGDEDNTQVALINNFVAPASSPLVAFIEGLALVETGFVDYYTAWRAVEVLEEQLQVTEEVYEALPEALAVSDTYQDGSSEGFADDDEDVPVLVRHGWLDPNDTRFSAFDRIPPGATALLDKNTVLLQWRAPYDGANQLSSTPRTSARVTPQRPLPRRLVSQKEAKKLLLHDLLQRYVHGASNRMPSEDKYIPTSSASSSSDASWSNLLRHSNTVTSARLGQTLPTALNRLADFYYRGESSLLGIDVPLALQYYRSAAALGHTQAAFNAGMMLQMGLGSLGDDMASEMGNTNSAAESSGWSPASLQLSLTEATDLVTRHPLFRVLSVFPSLPVIGRVCFGWVLRLQEVVIHVLTLPSELLLQQAEDEHRLYGPPLAQDWHDTNDYLFLHFLHIFFRNPVMRSRCDLHLATRYYDSVTSLNPRAEWASKVMMWTLKWQSWWLDIPYTDTPQPIPTTTTTTSKPATPSEKPGNPPARTPEKLTEKPNPKPTPQPSSPSSSPPQNTAPSRVKLALSWLWSYMPTYYLVETIVLYGAVVVLGIALYLIFI